MPTNSKRQQILSYGFLIAALIFVLILGYATLQAQAIANNWQNMNERALLSNTH